MNTSSSSSSIVSGVSQSRKVVAAEIDDHEDQEVLEDLFRISMKGYEMAEADSGKQTRHFDNREDLILLDGVDVDKHSRRKRNKEAPSQRSVTRRIHRNLCSFNLLILSVVKWPSNNLMFSPHSEIKESKVPLLRQPLYLTRARTKQLFRTLIDWTVLLHLQIGAEWNEG